MSQPEYDVAVIEDVMVPMRDDVRLAADIYRPARDGVVVEGRFPVLLERTPYNKRSLDHVDRHGRFFARRGYIVVLQDCRGCHASEGELYFLKQEGPDGYNTVQWLHQQPWCNGKIGTLGTSYMAWVQSALATLNPPGLAAMWVNEGGSNAHTSAVRQGGAMELRFLCWAFWHAALNAARTCNPALRQALLRVDVRDWLRRMPWKRGHTPLALWAAYERWAFDLLTHGDYDDYWKDPSINFEEHWDQHADVPLMLSGSWYDSYTRSTLDNFAGLSQRNRGPVRLIMGPWTHGMGTMEVSYAGGVDLGPEAVFDYSQEHLRWFDRWLKGLDAGVDGDPPVKLFIMGGGDGHETPEGRLFHGGRWRAEKGWPLARTRYMHYYLQGDGSLCPDPPAEASAASAYTYDPQDPVPTIGGNVSSLSTLKLGLEAHPDPSLLPGNVSRENIVEAGGWDQRERADVFGARPPYNMPLAARPDVLVFQTPLLEQEVEVTGPIAVTLWASSSSVDTDFTAKLIDVYPPSADWPAGFALNLTDSIIRARYRNSRERAELMTPGQVYQFTITLYPTANLFQAGHRIRLDVSSSNFPRFDVNPNTGEPLGQHTHMTVARNTIYYDRDHPSHVVLPVIPS